MHPKSWTRKKGWFGEGKREKDRGREGLVDEEKE